MNSDDKFCRNCGRAAVDTSAATSPGAPAPYAGIPETSPKALASLVAGLLFFVPFAFVVAIIFGHISLSEIRKSAGRLKGEGIAMAGLVLGYLWLAGVPIVLIVAAIAIPNLLRARMAANESSAVASVRTVNMAEVSYSQAHLDAGYTCSLYELAEAGLISHDLVAGRKSGYSFALSACSAPDGSNTNSTFKIVASPVVPNQTGVRAFCSDQSLVIRVDSSGSARECMESGSPLQ